MMETLCVCVCVSARVEAGQRRVLDEATRQRRLTRQLEALEKDNFQVMKHDAFGSENQQTHSTVQIIKVMSFFTTSIVDLLLLFVFPGRPPVLPSSSRSHCTPSRFQ